MRIRNFMIVCSLLAVASVAQATNRHLPKNKLSATHIVTHKVKARAGTKVAQATIQHLQKSDLSTAQIVARNVKARGGTKAWDAVKTLTMTGKLDAGGKKDTQLAFTMRMKRPHKSRLEIEFQDKKAIQVFDGKHGWKVRPFLGRNDAEPFSPAETKAAEQWQALDGTLIDHVKKGIKVKVEGIDKVEKHKAYKLKLTMKDGETRHLWVDAKTFLEIKIDGQPRKMDGKMRQVSVYYRDYHTQNGLKVPHEYETAVDGVEQSYKMHIDKVVVNKKMDDKLFEKPMLVAASYPAK